MTPDFNGADLSRRDSSRRSCCSPNERPPDVQLLDLTFGDDVAGITGRPAKDVAADLHVSDQRGCADQAGDIGRAADQRTGDLDPQEFIVGEDQPRIEATAPKDVARDFDGTKLVPGENLAGAAAGVADE